RKKLTLLEEKTDSIAKRMETAEGHIGEAEDKLHHVENANARIETELLYLKSKYNDLENRAHQSNLRIVGILEGAEGRDPVSFIEKFLPTIFGENTFPDKMEIERAHLSVQGQKKEKGPEPLLLNYYLYKERAMRRARELGKLTWNNSKIYLFLDISVELLAARKRFNQAKQMCHERKIKFALQYPAKLHLSLSTGFKYFTDPQKAEDFLRLQPSDTKAKL
uniref:L1 transposable element RRM domain-containing protein n=1 Tax=Latimeria chalumnae TaxID=7897 RepID=H3A4F6_LATCH